ncbi:PEPxxWA-CTERM sorting domain-containing protein [Sphingomonas aliaeris]|uniref:PEPxxWA-CTERM sorting domain-containing protein n=1 Tax=Sphingomonas aliaeris TaxID=2759526 RepID=A0A974NTG1_9SPHN|nr:PEPxxWA-CTERM sorting domain-containing protein [Sphingomonas aliaeris]QQV76566.1 PEPxxWA-CTERM sorting domain-containing protein [Sphingomonas aliaeris]
MKSLYLAAALAATALTATSASAATPLTVTYNGTITGSSVGQTNNLNGPVVFTGLTTLEDASNGVFQFSSFTALYQNALFTFADASASFANPEGTVLNLFTGTTLITSFNFAPGTNFMVGQDFATTLGAGGTFTVTPSAGNVNFTGGVGTVTSAVAAAVPETATWGMMIAGFGMMGAALRARRRSTKVSFA